MKPGPKPLDPVARFDRHLILGDPNGCWLWGGHIYRTGYGAFGKSTAHRFAYEAFVGPVPAGLEIDHLCRVRACCNPRHLEAVTRSVNFRRKPQRTHCAEGHELTTYVRKNGHRNHICLECGRESTRIRTARYRARKQLQGSES